MKKTAILVLLVLVTGMLSACAGEPVPPPTSYPNGW